MIKNFLKKFIAYWSIIFCIFFSTVPAFAGPDIGTGANGLTQKVGIASGFSTNATQYTLSETIGRAIKILLGFVGTIFFVLTVYAGFLWMTAQGNEEKIAKAKGILTTATIGLVIVVAAYSITAFVMIFAMQSTTF